jgi:hypothetical protein
MFSESAATIRTWVPPFAEIVDPIIPPNLEFPAEHFQPSGLIVVVTTPETIIDVVILSRFRVVVMADNPT